MSGLAGLLAKHTRPGVYRWHGAFHVPDVRHTVEHAGWRFAYVDGWRAQRRNEFLSAVAKAFQFPEHFGGNFDAMADCLRDVHGPDDTGVVLLWDGWGTLARDDEAAFSKARAVLAQRAAEDQGGAFVALLRGEGPEPDGVPSLD